MKIESNNEEEYIKNFYKRTWDDHRATIQRFDYLLVTVDGAGIYLVLELMKFLFEQKIPITSSLKICGISFALSIILNLLSQFYSFNVCDNVLKIEKNIIFLEESLEKYNKKIKIYTLLASSSMWISLILMILGVVGLIVFLYNNF
ncbi:hypothetical protein ASE21_19510 [Flavobacterium sp. Root901]|uniref:hypothetical protein n=1 Tax=Flavobacterium sp. Root901 TaxID=1736605 RepID=UPI00070CEEC1|nr:hypothetical protein [Flavobacterium sp. Root901]KRD06357.1 hypothetical protein ASE21_19510 [Flavobacterium sp. Root901]